MKKSGLALILLALLAGAPAVLPVFAAEEGEEAAAPTPIPPTLDAIRAAIKTQEQKLADTIAAKKLDQVHEVAFAIRDLVNALPDKSPDLDATRLERLRNDGRYVVTLAGRLDTSGDAGDQAATEASFKQLQSILANVDSLYEPAKTGDTTSPGGSK